FATLVQDDIAVKVVILNNGFLGMVRQWQELFFEKRYSMTHIESPDFIGVAKAYRIDGQKVTKRSELQSGIQKMLQHKGPYVFEVEVEQEENVFPMIPSGATVEEVRLE
ncbi:MAG: acetolactate synthase 2 catalytic subunit, partial [Parcubacteria group bacterium CG11_big_fil_rev_8_21_14_0_20_39_22]